MWELAESAPGTPVNCGSVPCRYCPIWQVAYQLCRLALPHEMRSFASPLKKAENGHFSIKRFFSPLEEKCQPLTPVAQSWLSSAPYKKHFFWFGKNASIEKIKNVPPLFISRNRMALKVISIVAQVWFSEQDGVDLTNTLRQLKSNELRKATQQSSVKSTPKKTAVGETETAPAPSSVNRQLSSHCLGSWRQRTTLMIILQLTWFYSLLGFLKSEIRNLTYCMMCH